MEKYMCCNCGHIFDPEDAATHYQPAGEFWGMPVSEPFDACPECGSDDLDTIEQPYEECEENEDCNGQCDQCELYKGKEDGKEA